MPNLPKDKSEKVNKVIQVLKTEYPFEGLLLCLLGALVLILGVYIFEGEHLRITFTQLWIFDSPFKIRVFSIIVMAIGAAAILVALAPFFIPGLKEMRRVSWPTKSLMYNHTARVFGFIIVLGIMFVLYDQIFRPIFNILYDLGA